MDAETYVNLKTLTQKVRRAGHHREWSAAEFSPTFPQVIESIVAHALLRAASRLLATPLCAAAILVGTQMPWNVDLPKNKVASACTA